MANLEKLRYNALMSVLSKIKARLFLFRLAHFTRGLMAGSLAVILIWLSFPKLWATLPHSTATLKQILLLLCLLGLSLFLVSFWKILQIGPSRFTWLLEMEFPEISKGTLSAAISNQNPHPLPPKQQTQLQGQALLAIQSIPKTALMPIQSLGALGSMVLILLLTLGPLLGKNHQIMDFLLQGRPPLSEIRLLPPASPLLANRSLTLYGEAAGIALHPLRIEARDPENRLLFSQIVPLRETSRHNLEFSAELKNLRGKVILEAYSGEIASSRLELSFLDPLLPSRTGFLVELPDYLQKQPVKVSRLPETLPLGSQITHEVLWNRTPESVLLKTSDREILASIGEKRSESSLNPQTSLTYTLWASDDSGFTYQSDPFQIQIVTDTPPRLQILKPEEPEISLARGSLNEIPVSLTAEDDFGLKELRWELKIKQQFEMTFMSTRRSGSIPLSGIRTHLDSSFLFRRISMNPGDKGTLNLYLSDLSPSNPETPATTIVVFVPLKFEKLEKLEEETLAQLEKASDLKQGHAEMAQQENELMESLSGNAPLNSAQQDGLRESLKMREEMLNQLKELESQMNQTLQEERLGEEQLLDEATLRKMAKIRDLFRELGGNVQQDLDRLRQMAASMQNLKGDELQQMMQQFDAEKFQQEIDRALQGLEELKEQQMLGKNLARLDHLRQKHQKALEQMAMGATPPEETLEEMSQEFENLTQELEEALKNSQMDENLAEELRNAVKEAKKQYQEAQKNQDSPEKRLQAMRDKLNSIRSLQAQMEHTMEKAQQKSMTISLIRLIEFLRETHHISRRLQWLQEHLQTLSGMPRKRTAAMELAFIDTAMESLAGEMAEEYRSNLSFQSAILDLSRLLKERLAESVRLYGSDNPAHSYHPILMARNASNQINSLLLNLLEQMQMQKNEQQSQQAMDSLQQLRNQQKELGEQMQRLQQTPVQSQARAQMMQQLALQQELIRQSTENLRRKMQKKAELARKLEEARSKMQEIEASLKDKARLPDNRENLQDEIDMKLMEAQDVLKKQKEESEERREAKAAQTQNPAQTGLSENTSDTRELQDALNRQDIPIEFLGIIQEFSQTLK